MKTLGGGGFQPPPLYHSGGMSLHVHVRLMVKRQMEGRKKLT